MKRALRAETIGTSIRKRMKILESDSYNLARSKHQGEPEPIEQPSAYHGITPEVGELHNQRKKTKLKRKVELERERRAGLTQLFEDLDYWVEMDEK